MSFPARPLCLSLLVVATTGCVQGLYHRPSLGRQLLTREIEVVASQGAPTVVWLPHVGGSTEQVTKPVASPPGLAEPAAEAGSHAALAAAIVAAGNRGGLARFVGSSRAGAPSPDSGLTLESPPPAGRAIYGVWITRVAFVGSDAGDRPLVLQASMRAEEGTDPSEPYRSLASVVTVVTDSVPRTRAEWTADGGKAIGDSLALLVERGAADLVAQLTTMTGAGAVGPNQSCGLQPTRELTSEPLLPGRATLRWRPHVVEGEGLPPLRTTYDVRVWKLAETVEPVGALDGLLEPAVQVTLEAGAEYAMTARASLEAEGGRRWTTPWSAPAPNGALCTSRAEPHLVLRRVVGNPAQVALRTELPPPAELDADGASPAAVVATHAGPARVVPARDPVRIGFARGPTRAGEAAAVGAGVGAVQGLAESFRCLIFMPLCAMVLMPVGAVVGSVAAGVEEASLATGSGPRNDLLRALAAASKDPGLQRLMMEAASGMGPVRQDGGAPAGTAPEARLEIGLVRASLAGGKTENPAPTLEVEVAATLHRDGAPPERRAIVAIGPGPVPLDAWVREDQALLRGAIRTQSARAAKELLRAFSRPPAPQAAPAAAAPAPTPPKWEPEPFQ